MKFLQSLGKFLSSPLFIGAVFTAAFTWTAMEFYTTLGLPDNEVPRAIQLLRKFHQISIDWRLKDRGPRKGSDQVVILTVDEKSLEQEGRWPWPRGKIKKIIERLIEGGGKVIAFDMIFSEPDNNAGVVALQRLKEQFPGGPEFERLIEKEIATANTDKDLAKAVEDHSEQLVIGTYFDAPIHGDRLPGYQNLCLNRLFQQTEAAEAWQNIAPVVIPIDQTLMNAPDEMPNTLATLLDEHFEQVKQSESARFLQEQREHGFSDTLSPTLRIELRDRVTGAQIRYCSRWLVKPEKNPSREDENYDRYLAAWERIAEEDETLKNLSPEDGIQLFKNRQLKPEIESAGKWWLNLPAITASAAHMAYFNAFQDPDGAIRKSNLVVRTGNQIVPSLAFRTYLVANNYIGQLTLQENPKSPDQKGISALEVQDSEGTILHKIPVNERGELTINYAGPQKMFAYLSTADVLNDEPNARISFKKHEKKSKDWVDTTEIVKKSEFYKDKIFVFGATAIGIYDLRVTPFEENYPGVETHANVIDNLLRKDFLVRHDLEEARMIIFIAVGGLILSFLIGRLGAVWGLVLASGLLGILYFADKYLLFGRGIVIAVIFPTVLVLGLYFVLTIYKYFTEERSKKQLKGTFGKYVSPAIVEEILSDPSKIELGGSKEHITVFFSDVRGFTTISEKLDAASLSDLLNSYLTPMTNIIFENKGTLDKYMGDAIMAFFGAPIKYPDHANYACRSALQNIEKLKVLQADYQKKGLPMIDVGIGINTGEMSVGNMGSDTVRNYTVMGDAVNLGSRLEGINKQYGTRIIVSEFTQKELSPDFVTREIDWVRVKGKAEPVRIYELIAEGKIPVQQQEMLKHFNEGFQMYHRKDWDLALNHFSKALDINPADPVSKLYVERCQDYKTAPPAENWDGVFVMTTK